MPLPVDGMIASAPAIPLAERGRVAVVSAWEGAPSMTGGAAGQRGNFPAVLVVLMLWDGCRAANCWPVCM